MIFIIFFIFIPFVYTELHTFITTYTGIRGMMTAEFFAVSSLDGQQIDYYDSDTMKLIPRQDWMEEFGSKDLWKDYTEIRKQVQQIYNISVHDVMEQFSHSDGLHTYQRRYGCEWDDETEDIQGFDEYGYDGEDFISLDLKELRYITAVQEGFLTVMKWNNDRTLLKILQQYFRNECVYWLKEFLHLSKAAFKKTDPPKVSLLQKNPDSYMCHVTGFLFRNTIISWRKNGQDINSSSELETGDTLPNGDGTFQRTLTLYVLSKRWKKDQYTCVVEHQSLTETIQKILTEDEIKSNNPRSDASDLMSWVIPVIIVIVITVLIVLCVLWKHRKELKSCNTQTNTHVENQHSHRKHGEASPRLISTPSCDDSSSSEACES